MIYAGHFLTNEQSLRDVFRPRAGAVEEENSRALQVVHMVCSAKEELMSRKLVPPKLSATPACASPAPTFPSFPDVSTDLNQVYAQAYHN